MPLARVVPATRELAELLAPTMRAEDAAEVLASGGFAPLEALFEGLSRSEVAQALLLEGEVAAIWGVVPLPRRSLLGPQAGIVWLLTGTAVERHQLAFLRLSRPAVAALLTRYALLTNCVDCRYAVALRWAAWLGFTLSPPAPFGAAGLPFQRITLSRGGYLYLRANHAGCYRDRHESRGRGHQRLRPV